MQTLHILLTTDTWGGIWTFTLELSQQLRKQGCRVTLASLGPKPSTENLRELEHADIPLHSLPWRLEWMQAAERDTAEAQRHLAWLAAELRVDLVHANHFAFACGENSYPTVLTVHSDVVSWWRHVRQMAPPPDKFHAWYRGLVLRALANAGQVVAPTRAVDRDLRQSYSCSRPVVIISNGRAAAEKRRAPVKQNLAAAMGRVWDDAKQLAWLGQWKWPIPIEVAGSLRHPENGAAPTLPQTPDVRFLGELNSASRLDLLERARLFIGCARYEPFGLSALEAALAGCALVLADIESQREIWSDTAYYFPPPPHPDARPALEHILASLAAAPAQCDRAATAARRLALERYHSSRMAKKYLRLYCQALAHGAPTPARAEIAETPCA